jgi:hypothetical protein
MFRGICTFIALSLIVAAPALAQKPAGSSGPLAPVTAAVEKPIAKSQANADARAPLTAISPGDIKATPEMWFYEQYMRQYQDPKMAVRARAEFEADQRQRRMAAMHWFGMSNSRPRAASDPFHGEYSPSWASNNCAFPYRWQGIGPTWYVVKPEPSTAYNY